MSFSKDTRHNTLNGILFVALFSLASVQIAGLEILQQLQISPLLVGMIVGIFYANTLRSHMPQEWVAGLHFCSKWILRTAIVFYGFRITFQNIFEVGLEGVIISFLMVSLTFIFGYLVGVKILKLDKDLTILISSGASICGAAAVLATEPVVKAEPYKTAIAVATVVLFGTIAMFLYPFIYNLGYIPFSEQEMGLYIGGSIHEVAHVVAAGNAISPEVGNNAVIVKMIRVMMLAPFLVILGIWLSKCKETMIAAKNQNETISKSKIIIPWFAVLFIIMAGFNSLNIVPSSAIEIINNLDNFALTMAMTALGMETSLSKFKNLGAKPFYLAGILFLWLIFAGFSIVWLF